MNKAFLLTICLLLTSFTGCIETDDSDLETVESVDEVIDENNNTVDETNNAVDETKNTVDETSTTEVPPTIILFVSEHSTGKYYVEVIKVTRDVPLEDFMFFLKDGSGSTYVGGNGFGEIAMQIQGGTVMGIDMTYFGPEEVLENRAANISADDGSEFPVHFSDNDRDGNLTVGDQFLVYGPEGGPAQDGWKLDIQFDATGDIIGSAKLL